MKHLVLTFAAAIAFSSVARADQVFCDITFSSPEHTVGSVPATGKSSTRPSKIRFGRPIVASSLGALRDQPLVFNTEGNSPSFYYDQIELSVGHCKFYYVAFDLYTDALIGSTNHFVVLFDTPTVRNILFKSDGTVQSQSWGSNGVIGSFADRSLLHCEVHVDLVQRRATLFINQSEVHSGPFSADYGIESIRFSLGVANATHLPNHDTKVGLDNIIVADHVVSRVFPPVAHAGEDQLIYLGEGAVTEVTLDGSGSYDPMGRALIYEWLWVVGGQLFAASGMTPTIELPVGEHLVELTVNNGTYESEPDEVVVTVLDVTPPVLDVSVDPCVLWPANNKMVLIVPTTTASDNSGYGPEVRLASITNSEAESSRGGRKRSEDIVVDAEGAIYLRASRIGKGGDHVYTLTYAATDMSGNVTQASATVTVPHDMRDKRQGIKPRDLRGSRPGPIKRQTQSYKLRSIRE